METTKNYFGMKPYTAITDTGRKTASGSAILEVLFEDGTSVFTTEKFFSLVKSEVPLDATAFRDLLYPKLIPEIYTVLSDWNIAFVDVPQILEKIKATIETTVNNAVNFSVGVNMWGDFDLLKVNEINAKAEAAKNPATAGGTASA